MKPRLFKTESALATKKLAALFVKEISHSRLKLRNALVIALTGELGSGKTTFVQGLARSLGIKHRLISPTFLIIRSYKSFYHIDCYRIKKLKEIKMLNFEKILKNSKNIVIIEWADKVKRLLPKKTIWIKFQHGRKENERIIYIYEKPSSY